MYSLSFLLVMVVILVKKNCAFGYAVDIVLLCPTKGLKKYIKICEVYAVEYYFIFNEK